MDFTKEWEKRWIVPKLPAVEKIAPPLVSEFRELNNKFGRGIVYLRERGKYTARTNTATGLSRLYYGPSLEEAQAARRVWEEEYKREKQLMKKS